MAPKWEDEITDPEILRMASEAETRARNRSEPDSFYRSAKAGIDLAFDSADAMDQHDGLYIMFKAALAGRDEPFVFHHLTNYYEAHLFDDPSAMYFRKVFWHQAATCDFLPSLVNAVWQMQADGGAESDEMEAYLRYGVDLDAEDGGPHILPLVRDFYLNPLTGRDPQGYLRKVAERYRNLGDEQAASGLEYEMHRDNLDTNGDPAGKIDAAKAAIRAGNI
ncbi:MAG: hypothetical protein ACK5LJ_01645 [Paracoccus sp. (in: a-proteobacteria)]